MFALLFAAFVRSSKYCFATDAGKCDKKDYPHKTKVDMLDLSPEIYVPETYTEVLNFDKAKTYTIIGSNKDVKLYVKDFALKLNLKSITLSVDSEKYGNSIMSVTLDNAYIETRKEKKLIVDVNNLVYESNCFDPSVIYYAADLELSSVPGEMEEDARIIISKGELTNIKFNIKEDAYVSFGSHRVILSSQGIGKNGLRVTSRQYSTSLTINHEEGKLTIGRYGRPRPGELFSTTIESKGEVKIAKQQWGEEFNTAFDARISVVSDKIKIQGHGVPMSISPKGKELTINVDADVTSILGTVGKVTSLLNGKVTLKGKGEFQCFDLFSALLDKNSLIIEDGVELSIRNPLSKAIDTISKFVTLLFSNIEAGLKEISEKVIEFATDAFVNIKLKLKNIVESGKVIAQNVKFPESGSVSLFLNMTMADIQIKGVKELLKTPVNFFCSKEEFDCSRFEFEFDTPADFDKATNFDFGMERKCEWTDMKNGDTTEKYYCLTGRLTHIPEWLPERICIATDSKQCPDDSLVFAPDKLEEAFNDIHESAKQAVIELKEDLADGKEYQLNLGKLGTINTNLKIVGELGDGKFPKVKLNIDGDIAGHVGSLELDNAGLDIDVAKGQTSVSLDIPFINLKNINIEEAIKDLNFEFKNNEVTVDKETLKKLAKATYNNLTIAADKLTQIAIDAKEFILSIDQEDIKEALDKVADTLKAIDVNLNGDFKITHKDGVTKLEHGIGLSVTGPGGKIIFDGSWDQVTEFNKDFEFRSTTKKELTISGLPNGAKVQLGGSSDIKFDAMKGASVKVDGDIDIESDGFKITLPSGKDIEFQGIDFTGHAGKGGKFEIVRDDGSKVQAIVSGIKVEAGATGNIGDVKVNGDVTIGAGAILSPDKISFGVAAGRSALASNNVRIGYTFSEGGFGVLNAETIEGIPSITVFYNVTEEEKKKVNYDLWTDYPQQIIIGKNLNCQDWVNAVSFDKSGLQKGYNMYATCDEDTDVNGRVSIMAVLEKEEESGLSTVAIVFIVIGCIAAVALIALAVFCVVKHKKKDLSSAADKV